MRMVIATTASDPLGGIFARAYYEAGGMEPRAVFVLGPRREQSYPLWARWIVALKWFSAVGTLRLALARGVRVPLGGKDRQWGLHRDWISTLCPSKGRVHRFRDIHDRGALAALRDIEPDLLVSIGAPSVFRPCVLKVPRKGAINVHNGRLPDYRGHFGTFWEVLRGERWAHVSIHEMARKVDAGRVLASSRVDIASARSFLDLMMEKKWRGGGLLARVVRSIGGQAELHPEPLRAGPSSPTGEYFAWPSLRDALSFSWQDRVKECPGGENDRDENGMGA